MALTLAKLEKLVEAEGMRFFRDPTRDALMTGAKGIAGHYQFMILLELEGQFLQFRTVNYQYCKADHKHLKAVLEVLGGLNYRLRLAKFGWDESDGEIVVYADHWIMDGTVTQEQFSRILHNYLPAVDLSNPRIAKTIETGNDPGELDPETILRMILEQAEGADEEEDGKKKKKPKTKKI
ncbi:MAG: hypothetical protein GTO46_15200 [Gemmatimonadetes bacterium]|nr:hypothetical protein [Gemmatimonadota bacterium]NIO32985.1 hypothetical protein [Gemmatimonadota bacterium]